MINNPSLPIYSIYCITNLINGKKYVGFTSLNPPKKRFKKHCKKLNTVISKAIQKYGQDNFKFEVILQGLDKDHILEMEIHFINKYNTLSPNGYNLTTGGEHFKHTDETKEKISNLNKGRPSAKKGISDSNETKRKKSESSKGKIKTKEHCKNISIAKTGKYRKPFTNETKLKMSKFQKNKILSLDHKLKISNANSKKYLIQLPDGEIKEVHGLKQFCKNENINRNCLFRAFKVNKIYKRYKIISKVI